MVNFPQQQVDVIKAVMITLETIWTNRTRCHFLILLHWERSSFLWLLGCCCRFRIWGRLITFIGRRVGVWGWSWGWTLRGRSRWRGGVNWFSAFRVVMRRCRTSCIGGVFWSCLLSPRIGFTNWIHPPITSYNDDNIFRFRYPSWWMSIIFINPILI